MSGEVFKLYEEAVSQEFEFVPAELMEVFSPAHFIERQVTFYFILKRFPGVHCNSRNSGYAEHRRVPLSKPVPERGPAEFGALEPSRIFNEQIVRTITEEPDSVRRRFLGCRIVCCEDQKRRAHV